MARRMIHMPADTDLNRLFDAWTLANKVLAEQGLSIKGWTVVFDNTKHRAGQCRYSSKELGLSAHLIAIWEWDHVRNVILHEIAHILVPAKRGNLHGREWKAKFIELAGMAKGHGAAMVKLAFKVAGSDVALKATRFTGGGYPRH